MTKDIFKDKQRGDEAAYFHKRDTELIEKLRANAKLQEIAAVLAQRLEVQDPELLRRTTDLGIDLSTASAFLLAPLVQVAWADGDVSDRERETILRLARERGLEDGSPAEARLLEWLQNRPPDAVFDTAIEVLRAGLSMLPDQMREERIDQIRQRCREVAEASGGIAKALGLGSGTSGEEKSVLDVITAALRG